MSVLRFLITEVIISGNIVKVVVVVLLSAKPLVPTESKVYTFPVFKISPALFLKSEVQSPHQA